MKQPIFFSMIMLLIISSCTHKADHPLISGELVKLATDFKFTEGPASDAEGKQEPRNGTAAGLCALLLDRQRTE